LLIYELDELEELNQPLLVWDINIFLYSIYGSDRL